MYLESDLRTVGEDVGSAAARCCLLQTAPGIRAQQARIELHKATAPVRIGDQHHHPTGPWRRPQLEATTAGQELLRLKDQILDHLAQLPHEVVKSIDAASPAPR